VRYLCATCALPVRYLCATCALPVRYLCATSVTKDAQVGSRSHALSREISGMGPWTLCPGFVGGPELFSSVPSSLKNELL